ncbi:hypothetical protein JTB14_015029 [Gonioctena quinquepunctata]|nr:hypothetical protein JTB14_015029 [Gonioctena quinquepunctata]
MAEAETPTNPEDIPRRRPHQQNMRPPYSGRGRGRGRSDPHVMKALHNFGVRDLREFLDRKHQEEQMRGVLPENPSYNYLPDPDSGRGRGRGRSDPHATKVLHNFSERDFRELHDRKHQEEQMRGGPPADPSYNYLSDPERENFDHSHKERHSQTYQGGPTSWAPRGRGTRRGNERSRPPSFIQNPLNIQVQFSTSTGERNYHVDESNILGDIKHVPDYMYPRGRGGHSRGRPRESRGERRGRGRGGPGRGRGQQSAGIEVRSKSVERGEKMFESEVRNDKPRGRGGYRRSKSVETRDKASTNVSEGEESESRCSESESRNAESGVRGARGEFRGRGRGGRGRGQRRGQGRHWSNSANRNRQSKENTEVPEVPTEENWDIGENNAGRDAHLDVASGNSNLEVAGVDTQIDVAAGENDHVGQPETDAEQFLDAEVDSEEHDNIEGSNIEKESQEEEKREEIREKLVITSSVQETRSKRTVRFDVKDDEKNELKIEGNQLSDEKLKDESLQQEEPGVGLGKKVNNEEVKSEADDIKGDLDCDKNNEVINEDKL